jgi:LacI family transcriptional regulator
MVNIKQVAREAGVSTATVSRVLNDSGYASKEARERVYQAIERLNYRPSAIARSLKQDRTSTIGILVPDISNPYFMQMSKGIEDVVRGEGYHLIFASTDEDPEKEAHLLGLFSEQRVDVVVLAASASTEAQLAQMVRSGIHVILADRRLPGASLELDTFIEDNVAASRELTECLIREGHERIAVIHGGIKVSTSAERLAGCRAAMEAHGIRTDERYWFDGRFTEEGGKKAVRQWLGTEPRPTAVLALNNAMAFGALLQLNDAGVKIPEEMAVASFGEVEAAKLLKGSNMWHVRQKPRQMGEEIGRRILAVRQNEELLRARAEKTFKPEIARYD